MNKLAKGILAFFVSVMLVFTGIAIWAEWKKDDVQVYPGYGREIYLGDLNGDGFQDIVDDGGMLFINTGGAFRMEKMQSNQSITPVLVKDVDKDGKAEILGVDAKELPRPTVLIGRYQGDGIVTVEKAHNLKQGQLLGVEDTNNDGQMEYITYGDLASGGCFPKKGTGYRMSIEMADFDGNGVKDLALNAEDEQYLCLFKNDGTGNFTKNATLYIGMRTGSMAAGDLNGDGRPDIAAVAWTGNKLVTFMNKGGWAFSNKTYDVPNPSIVRAGDLDSDGNLDLLVSDFDSDSVIVRMNDGKGNFGSQTSYYIDGTLYETRSALLFDIDNDGDLDFAGITFGWGVHIVVMKNDGNGRFTDMNVRGLGLYSMITALTALAMVGVWYYILIFLPKSTKIGPAKEVPEKGTPTKDPEIVKDPELSGKDLDDIEIIDGPPETHNKGKGH